MNIFLVCFISGASFLLSFILFFHPLHQNVKANKWLSLSVFTMGCAFIGSYLYITETTHLNNFLFKCLSSTQFLLAPSFYISILYFVTPTKFFNKKDWIHFLPFAIYVIAEIGFNFYKESIATYPLFPINKSYTVLVRDILPFISLFYVIKSYFLIQQHKKNLKRITADVNDINLDWIIQFLFILGIVIFIWINDAMFGLPYITEATNFIYAAAIFFLAYFSIKQKTIFAFKEKHILEISEILQNEPLLINEKQFNGIIETPYQKEAEKEIEITDEIREKTIKEKPKRLNADKVADLSIQLDALMEKEKLFLDNDLNLPMVAEKLSISIHEASFLINETAKDNFYNYINKYRVIEAKKLLTSSKIEELNILGIAFASGFNSKTTFNTTFKKIVGVSPSQFSKNHKN